MLYHNTTCPHCGNDVTVNEVRKTQKCRWCKRLMSVRFEKGKGKRFKCFVEPMDFPESFKPEVKSFTKWEEEDVYGEHNKDRNS